MVNKTKENCERIMACVASEGETTLTHRNVLIRIITNEIGGSHQTIRNYFQSLEMLGFIRRNMNQTYTILKRPKERAKK